MRVNWQGVWNGVWSEPNMGHVRGEKGWHPERVIFTRCYLLQSELICSLWLLGLALTTETYWCSRGLQIAPLPPQHAMQPVLAQWHVLAVKSIRSVSNWKHGGITHGHFYKHVWNHSILSQTSLPSRAVLLTWALSSPIEFQAKDIPSHTRRCQAVNLEPFAYKPCVLSLSCTPAPRESSSTWIPPDSQRPHWQHRIIHLLLPWKIINSSSFSFWCGRLTE